MTGWLADAMAAPEPTQFAQAQPAPTQTPAATTPAPATSVPAQATPSPSPQAAAAEPIGNVATLTGSATVTRHSATTTLQIRDDIYSDDEVTTAASSTLGITFNDATTFNLKANARIKIDSYVYEEGGRQNSALFDVAKGTVAFVAASVAKTGNMRISTPTATLGIRGTTGLVEVPEGATTSSTNVGIKLYPDADGRVGRIEVSDRSGSSLGVLTRGASGFAIRPGIGGVRFAAVPLTITPQQIARDQGFVRQLHSAQTVGRQVVTEQRDFRRANPDFRRTNPGAPYPNRGQPVQPNQLRQNQTPGQNRNAPQQPGQPNRPGQPQQQQPNRPGQQQPGVPGRQGAQQPAGAPQQGAPQRPLTGQPGGAQPSPRQGNTQPGGARPPVAPQQGAIPPTIPPQGQPRPPAIRQAVPGGVPPGLQRPGLQGRPGLMQRRPQPAPRGARPPPGDRQR
ncbi:FecR domain-containing protein [Bradyrhizobium lablabi]|uniref:FecR family protein n=1 Tax=Bradyrhizobium lablabi TaxID=722472 RepID=UPI001BA692B6|nr:FecR family protein [Bradyrhizobium lablabi]MBR0697172.1 FecR domain-containing protein [Bradyrhizobium lablabi]